MLKVGNIRVDDRRWRLNIGMDFDPPNRRPQRSNKDKDDPEEQKAKC
jgi:hypothetical protein